MVDVVNLLISICYFSIPIQLLVSLYYYRKKDDNLHWSVLVLCGLFILNFLACGVGHLLRALGHEDTTWNILTCFTSLSTALYLVPLVPSWVGRMDSYPTISDLVKLNEETAASKRKLFTFMNFLCHEIRNPLFAITSNIEFAQDMPMTPDVHESLSAINQSASLMLRLVNDVLDLSKIESGKLELEKQQFNIRDFFQNMAASMSRQVLAKRDGTVKFVFDMAQDVPKLVQSDSVRLLQICYNLLSNASKFTERGAITFTVDVHKPSTTTQEDQKESSTQPASPNTNQQQQPNASAELSGMSSLDQFSLSLFKKPNDQPDPTPKKSNTKQPSNRFLQRGNESKKSLVSAESSHEEPPPDHDIVTLRLQFEDTGIGIEEEHLERIFLPYAQSKLSDFRRHGGTGLGLSIIYKLLGMMNGTITVTSKVGEGTKFTILLPVVVPKDQGEPEADPTNTEITGDIEDQQQQSTNLQSTPQPRRGSYAKIDEMELFKLDEEGEDQITPLSSLSSVGNTMKRLSLNSAVGSGAVSLGALPPERDDSATPQVKNTTDGTSYHPHSPHQPDTLVQPVHFHQIKPQQQSHLHPQLLQQQQHLEEPAAQILPVHMLHNNQLPQDPNSIMYPHAPPNQHPHQSPLFSLPAAATNSNLQPPAERNQMDPSTIANSGPETQLQPLFAVPQNDNVPPNGINQPEGHENTKKDAPPTDTTEGKPLFGIAPQDTTLPNQQLFALPTNNPSSPTLPQSLFAIGSPATNHDEAPTSPLSPLPPLPASVQAPKPKRVPLPPPKKSKKGSSKTPKAPTLEQEKQDDTTTSKSQASAESLKDSNKEESKAPAMILPKKYQEQSVTPAVQGEIPKPAATPNAIIPAQPGAQPPGTLPALFAEMPSRTPVKAAAPRPQPTPMSANPSKARQLAKFNFPKNTNMVLVVDDNGINRKLIGKMLSYFNLEYQDAEHGKQAVEIMERSQNSTGDTSAPLFGMVIMDLCMPVMNGYEAIENLRKKLHLQVPIVALTASAMEDEKRKALEAGATEFATKPLLRPILHKKCEEYLR